MKCLIILVMINKTMVYKSKYSLMDYEKKIFFMHFIKHNQTRNISKYSQ